MKPGIGSTTFYIPLNRDWYMDQEIIRPDEKYLVTHDYSGVEYLTREEIISKYGDFLTDDQLRDLNLNR